MTRISLTPRRRSFLRPGMQVLVIGESDQLRLFEREIMVD